MMRVYILGDHPIPVSVSEVIKHMTPSVYETEVIGINCCQS